MRRFNYLIRRLHQASFTWVAALLMLLTLLPFLSGSLQPMGSLNESLRDPASPLNGFRFQWYGSSELAIGYLRRDQVRELSSYLSYLRQEKSLISVSEPDGDRRRYGAYLAKQESLHLDRLRETLGLIDQEAYYYGLYAPHWLQNYMPYEDLFGAGDVDLKDPSQREAFGKTLLASPEPILTAQGHNLLEGLPMTSEKSASTRLLYLIQVSRFFLALLPLTVFYLVFGTRDRNLREDRLSMDLARGATVFLSSAAALLLMRLVWYGVLYLRFADAAGAMFIVPPWLAVGETGHVMRLSAFIQWISAVDLAFLLFYSSFLSLLYALSRRASLSLLLGSTSLLLPLPLIHTSWTGPWDPLAHFSFLHWNLRPELFDHFPGVALVWGLPAVPYWQAPTRQIPGLLLWAILFLVIAWLAGTVRKKVSRKRKSTPGDPPGNDTPL